jgi:hypothetical protein
VSVALFYRAALLAFFRARSSWLDFLPPPFRSVALSRVTRGQLRAAGDDEARPGAPRQPAGLTAAPRGLPWRRPGSSLLPLPQSEWASGAIRARRRPAGGMDGFAPADAAPNHGCNLCLFSSAWCFARSGGWAADPQLQRNASATANV